MYQILTYTVIKGSKKERKTPPVLVHRSNDLKEAQRLLEAARDEENGIHAYMIQTETGAIWDDGLWIVYK